jgi:hypothetical protein
MSILCVLEFYEIDPSSWESRNNNKLIEGSSEKVNRSWSHKTFLANINSLLLESYIFSQDRKIMLTLIKWSSLQKSLWDGPLDKCKEQNNAIINSLYCSNQGTLTEGDLSWPPRRLFCIIVSNVFNIRSSQSKQVGAWRSAALTFPLQ